MAWRVPISATMLAPEGHGLPAVCGSDRISAAGGVTLESSDWHWFGLAHGMPSASVADYGITLNPAAADLLGSPGHLAVGLNTDARLVALRPVDPVDLGDVKNPLPFPGRTRGGAIRINSRDLVRAMRHYFGLAEPTGRYLCRWEKNQLVIDLNVRLDQEGEQPDSATEEG